ncbi:IS66 family insertion sequence element accessory protein TnpB [Desulfobacula sp.]
MCRTVLNSNPFSGYLFVFLNRRKTAIKILSYDGQACAGLPKGHK